MYLSLQRICSMLFSLQLLQLQGKLVTVPKLKSQLNNLSTRQQKTY